MGRASPPGPAQLLRHDASRGPTRATLTLELAAGGDGALDHDTGTVVAAERVARRRAATAAGMVAQTSSTSMTCLPL